MKTAKDKKEAFLKDFRELLAKHNAEFEVDSDSDAFYSSIVDPYAEIVINGVYDREGETLEQYTEFKLPTHIPAPEKKETTQ